MRVLVTRPEPEASVLAARLAALGVEAMLAPLLAVEACPPVRLPLEGVAAVAVTSRNALRALAGHADLPRLCRLPLFAVGPGTAAAAATLGFADVRAGTAAARDLPALIATAGPLAGTLLVLRGERIAFELAAALAERGYATREAITYRAEPAKQLSPDAAHALSAGLLDGVVLMSPDTAKVFTKLVQGADLIGAASRLTYFCLSPAVVSAAAPPDGAEVATAVTPNLEEMLALVARKASLSAANAR